MIEGGEDKRVTIISFHSLRCVPLGTEESLQMVDAEIRAHMLER
jgi:hypothetical protein